MTNRFGLSDSIIRGMTGGASDYVSAAGDLTGDKLAQLLNTATGIPVKPDTGSMSYEGAMRNVSRDVNQAHHDNPLASYGGEAAGGLASPLFRALAGAVGPAGFFGQGLAAGAGVGAAGARNGQGGVPTAADVAQGAGQGAAVGGVLGAAAPMAAQAMTPEAVSPIDAILARNPQLAGILRQPRGVASPQANTGVQQALGPAAMLTQEHMQ